MGQVKPGGVHKDGVLCFAVQTRNNVNSRCFIIKQTCEVNIWEPLIVKESV